MSGAEREDAGSPYRILFVCTGNTCRSPLAEALARAELERRGWMQVRVASAGVAAVPGAPASPAAVTAAEDEGLDLRAHRARMATGAAIEDADLILAMGPSHLGWLAELVPAERLHLLGDFAAGEEAGIAVRDPFGGNVAEYRATLRELRELVRAALDRVAPIVAP